MQEAESARTLQATLSLSVKRNPSSVSAFAQLGSNTKQAANIPSERIFAAQLLSEAPDPSAGATLWHRPPARANGSSGSARLIFRRQIRSLAVDVLQLPALGLREEAADDGRNSQLTPSQQPGWHETLTGWLAAKWAAKLNHQVRRRFSPCFHLPGFHFGYLFLIHSQMAMVSRIQRIAVWFRYYWFPILVHLCEPQPNEQFSFGSHAHNWGDKSGGFAITGRRKCFFGTCSTGFLQRINQQGKINKYIYIYIFLTKWKLRTRRWASRPVGAPGRRRSPHGLRPLRREKQAQRAAQARSQDQQPLAQGDSHPLRKNLRAAWEETTGAVPNSQMTH